MQPIVCGQWFGDPKPDALAGRTCGTTQEIDRLHGPHFDRTLAYQELS